MDLNLSTSSSYIHIFNQSVNDDDSDPNNESAFECYDTRLDQNICLQIMIIKRLTLLKHGRLQEFRLGRVAY